MAGFIGVYGGVLTDIGMYQGNASGFRLGHERQGATVTLTHDNHDLTLAGLIGLLTQIAAVLDFVCGLHIAAKVSALDFNMAIQRRTVGRSGHGFAELVGHDEGGLVLHVKVTAQLQG